MKLNSLGPRQTSVGLLNKVDLAGGSAIEAVAIDFWMQA
jgi:hypothetical protein